MEPATSNLTTLAATSKRLARRLLTVGENRFELLVVAVQEERGLLLHAMLLAFGVVAFGLLGAMALSAAIVVALWAYAPVAVLVSLAVLHGLVGILLYRRLAGLLRDWHVLSSLLDQLRKDRACLEEALS
jgi:uncharacterized membrane protein YqjE